MGRRTDDYFITIGPTGELDINPYRECSYRCVYCIANAQGTAAPWYDRDETITRVREALHRAPENALVNVSGVSDPYPPIEYELGITRAILEELHRARTPYRVNTKGTLVTRDIDILSDYSVAHDVWMVLGTLDEAALSIIEPGAPTPKARVEASHQLVDDGVRLTINAAPFIPGVTNAEALVDALPASAQINITPLCVLYMGRKINLLGKTWTQAELMDAFRAAMREFKPRDNVRWLDTDYDKRC